MANEKGSEGDTGVVGLSKRLAIEKILTVFCMLLLFLLGSAFEKYLTAGVTGKANEPVVRGTEDENLRKEITLLKAALEGTRIEKAAVEERAKKAEGQFRADLDERTRKARKAAEEALRPDSVVCEHDPDIPDSLWNQVEIVVPITGARPATARTGSVWTDNSGNYAFYLDAMSDNGRLAGWTELHPGWETRNRFPSAEFGVEQTLRLVGTDLKWVRSGKLRREKGGVVKVF